VRDSHFFAAAASNPARLASFKGKLAIRSAEGYEVGAPGNGGQDLAGALDAFKVGKAERERLLAVLGPMQGAIVEKR
jgi:hypothetical protein